MKELTMHEVGQVNGGMLALDIAEAWVGTVAGVGLGLVGAPVLVAGAVGLGLAGAFIATSHLLEK
ncbi:hypothetical protein [Aerosticca soli]|jgi:hypothetical protein|uniref:hypothetical protein n=1 Tax=Aerosticca soli TaxID=2010829 RepID=UPI000F822A08|nr:hypothetical protein [Aerosticca soli]